MNRYSFTFAALLNLLAPGLGHAFWKEYSFGVFIFLVMVLSAILMLVSFLLPLSPLAKLALFGLPMLFYLFTFVDLKRVVRTQTSVRRTTRVTMAFLVGCMAWQCLSPLAAVNFVGRNAPEVFRQADNSLSPRFRQGDLLWSNSLAYRASIFFLTRPQLYALPEHGELVRFVDSTGQRRVGIAIGLPGEQIEVADGILMANSLPFDLTASLGGPVSGRVELTTVGGVSILVATVRLGSIDKLHQVPVTDIRGKVRKLL